MYGSFCESINKVQMHSIIIIRVILASPICHLNRIISMIKTQESWGSVSIFKILGGSVQVQEKSGDWSFVPLSFLLRLVFTEKQGFISHRITSSIEVTPGVIDEKIFWPLFDSRKGEVGLSCLQEVILEGGRDLMVRWSPSAAKCWDGNKN